MFGDYALPLSSSPVLHWDNLHWAAMNAHECTLNIFIGRGTMTKSALLPMACHFSFPLLSFQDFQQPIGKFPLFHFSTALFLCPPSLWQYLAWLYYHFSQSLESGARQSKNSHHTCHSANTKSTLINVVEGWNAGLTARISTWYDCYTNYSNCMLRSIKTWKEQTKQFNSGNI